MANFLTNAYRNRAIQGTEVDLSSTNLAMVLLDNGVDTAVATDSSMSDIAGGVIATSGNLAGKTFGTVATGVFDFTDPVFSAVSGASVEQAFVKKVTGTAATELLYGVWDCVVTPNGGDITVVLNASGAWKF
jgi:hypothetical protein